MKGLSFREHFLDPGPLPYQGNALDFKDSSTVNTLPAPNLGAVHGWAQ